MKYEWNPDKNAELKKERKISFEEIVFHLSRGDLWKTADHPDQEKYPEQKLYFVLVDDSSISFRMWSARNIFSLKTIIPSRKATKLYKAEK